MKTLGLFVCAMLVLPAGAQAGGLKAAVFDLQPVELPQTPAMRARMTTYTGLIRKLLADKGLTIVDLAPQAKKIADNLPLSECNGCDQDIAKALGADIEVTSAVQESSSVTFTLSGTIKDVATNRVLRSGVVDIRGENDDEWSHGVKFLIKERLTDPPLPADAASLKKLVDGAPKPD